MNTSTPSASEGSELVGTVTSTGSPAAPKEDIAPEDRHIADRILATNPLTDIGTSHKWPEGRSAPAPTLDALAPEMRKEAQAKLAGMNPAARAAAEPRVVAEVMQAYSRATFATGMGAEALPYHSEMRQIALDYRELAREFDQIQDQLLEVERYGIETDPETGAARPKEILKVQGPRREGYLARLSELSYRMRLLHNEADGTPGVEGARRLHEALVQSVKVAKGREEELAEREEAKRLAVQIARDKRVRGQAETLARFERGGLD